ncbi:MAG: flagellar basal body P-ring protein FlgI, partial [Tepidisphaeraceae bacterium]
MPSHPSSGTLARWFACVGVAVMLLALVGCGHKKPPPKPPRYPSLPAKQVPEFLKGTIFERVDLMNDQPLLVNNFGLVVNLDGTGSSVAPTAVRQYIIRQMLKRGFGSKLMPGFENMEPEDVLKDPRVAIVQVDGLIPPGARADERFDVQVSALGFPNNTTSSVARGELYRTDLAQNGANPNMPGIAINTLAWCEGPVFVNPAYALSNPKDPQVRSSLRFGVVLDGAINMQDRPLFLRLRQPQFSVSRSIEFRVDQGFLDITVASAFDEGVVQLYVPRSYRGDWEHFAGVATHLYFNNSTAFNVAKSQELAAEAVKPGAPLEDISYCWEGLGTSALPNIVPLMNNPSPEVAFAAARAAAFLGDSSARTVLLDMARTQDHPFQLSAVRVLGGLPASPLVNQMLRSLLDSRQTVVRLDAYRILAENRDPSIFSRVVNDKFILDIVPCAGPPLVYAARRGTPRIAIFGNKPSLILPATFAALDNRLTISSQNGQNVVSIFYRDPAVARPSAVRSFPDLADLVARLGGEGAIEEPQMLDFCYGDVVAIVR